MWAYLQSYMREVQQMAGHMGREEWIAVFVGVLIIGVFFLKGFGLRST